jgi:hypothetical protein
MLADYITDDVKAEFVRNPSEYVVSDDLGWLDDIIFAVTHRTCDIKELTGERLGREYRAFRAGHSTRVNDLAPFYAQGLKCLRAEEVEDRARTIFLNGRFAGADEERLSTRSTTSTPVRSPVAAKAASISQPRKAAFSPALAARATI